MHSIVLPEKVVLRLVDSKSSPLPVPKILLVIKAFANYKNDFELGPFVTNHDGVVRITKADLLADAAKHYDSGLMDYRSIEECKAKVLITAMTHDAIEKALEARSKVWTMLLDGELQRWGTLENLLNTYRTAANRAICVEPIATQWDGASPECEYQLISKLC